MLNPSGIEPIGGHVVIAIEKSETERRLAGAGLVMAGDTGNREKLAAQIGPIVAVAPDARFGLPDLLGKRALFGRYAGTTIRGVDGEDYRMLFDEDVKGTIDG